MNRVVTAQIRAEFRRLREEGLSDRQIAERCGCSHHTVGNHLARPSKCRECKTALHPDAVIPSDLCAFCDPAFDVDAATAALNEQAPRALDSGAATHTKGLA